MTDLATRLSAGDVGAFGARAELLTVPVEAMADAGIYVGPARRALVLPRGLDPAKARSGRGRRSWANRWAPGRILREPTMSELVEMGLVPEVVAVGHNVMCNAGITRMLNLLIAGGGQGFDATHTSTAVGDGNGSVPTAAATDTDLAALTGATHRQGEPVDATYPSISGQVLSGQSTYGTTIAVFHWREWAISQDTAATTAALTAPMLNHKGTDMGDFTGTSISKALKWTITES